MHSSVRPNQFVILRLPSETTKVVQIVPNTLINCGKFGAFPANQIIGRPFYLTFEILDSPGENQSTHLRIVSAAELHAESLITEGEGDDDVEVNEEGLPLRTNREIVDDASTQKLTLEEIETLKKESTGAGRDIIAKILESHSALDQKTAFSLAKYTLRKQKKYMKRFTLLPMDVSALTNYMLESRDSTPRGMELRDEIMSLIGSWGNVHHGGDTTLQETLSKPNGRYLVIDETGGLVLAAMAERMGLLHPDDLEEEENGVPGQQPSAPDEQTEETTETQAQRKQRPAQMSAGGNTITLIHANKQANTSLLKYFGFDQNSPDESHPLFTHLKTISWLQLLDPKSDPIYTEEPPIIPDSELATLKTNRRAAYHRKRNRWSRVQSVVNEVRAGGYDGLIVATLMDPESVLQHGLPLLAGSASVVIYSPTIEPLTQIADLYSTARKTAYISRKRELEEQRHPGIANGQDGEHPELSAEFPLNPTLLLAPTLETARIRHWQVLPGRTHPMMSGRGGAEGYIFHAVRVIPTTGFIQAAGNPGRKKRKLTSARSTATPGSTSADVEMKS
ncbi:tRNA 1-methyladenosine methyltransferase subunit GCD10 [Aspergillus lucknowensis]|uniref:tRNA (adenine(58)-N(1))-methyltransferase non-catalytic subunit TRM6 n=1 Tax=Aspergillus lucknowensis TaxID=176173 RepID=A0ABR4LKF5_9EURO